ncbi:MAG: HU family DNA-binding protein, partial [Bacteroidaceae bacterium]
IWTMAVFDCLADMLLKEKCVTVLNFGTFKVTKSEPRRRGDIASGESVIDPPRMRLKFTVAPAMDEKIKNLPVE